MDDRIVEAPADEVPEIPELVEKMCLFALDEAREKMEQAGEVVPFTALAVKDNLFIETHPGEEPEQCFAAARHTVQGARGADGYAFCYDGYVDADVGMLDALIAEGGLPGENEAYAIGYLYEIDEQGTLTFQDDPAYIGEAPNFMVNLKEADAYSFDELNARYLEEDEEFDFEAADEAELEAAFEPLKEDDASWEDAATRD